MDINTNHLAVVTSENKNQYMDYVLSPEKILREELKEQEERNKYLYEKCARLIKSQRNSITRLRDLQEEMEEKDETILNQQLINSDMGKLIEQQLLVIYKLESLLTPRQKEKFDK